MITFLYNNAHFALYLNFSIFQSNVNFLLLIFGIYKNWTIKNIYIFFSYIYILDKLYTFQYKIYTFYMILIDEKMVDKDI